MYLTNKKDLNVKDILNKILMKKELKREKKEKIDKKDPKEITKKETDLTSV